MLPWPPVILAMISLPQRTSQVMPAISNKTITRMMLVIILRFLDTGFFAFFGFLCLAVSGVADSVGSVDVRGLSDGSEANSEGEVVMLSVSSDSDEVGLALSLEFDVGEVVSVAVRVLLSASKSNT